MKRWSILTNDDGEHIVESVDTAATEAYHLELFSDPTGRRRLVAIYSDKADADREADWFGRTGPLRAEVTGPHVLAMA